MSSSSLLAMLTQRGGPTLATQKGLIVLCPQNDFLGANGKLTVENPTMVLDHVAHLVPAFREHGVIIWVRAEYDPSRSPDGADNVSTAVILNPLRPSSSKGSTTTPPHIATNSKKGHRRAQSKPDTSIVDPELYLSKRRQRGPCLVRKSSGASYVPELEKIIDRTRDIQVVTSNYSALQSTTLLQTLRMRFITDLYLAGCVSNLSVYATALDAARYGMRITLMEDCLGYGNLMRHQVAVKKLKTLIGAKTMARVSLIYKLRQNMALTDDEMSESGDVDDSEESDSETSTTTSSVSHVERQTVRRSLTSPLLPIGVDPRDRDEEDKDEDEEGTASEDSDAVVARTLRELNARLSQQSPRSNTKSHVSSQPRTSEHARRTRAARNMTSSTSSDHVQFDQKSSSRKSDSRVHEKPIRTPRT